MLRKSARGRRIYTEANERIIPPRARSMVLDAQPLEDEAGYGRLIELEAGDFLKKSFRPSRLCLAESLSVWMGRKERAVEKDP